MSRGAALAFWSAALLRRFGGRAKVVRCWINANTLDMRTTVPPPAPPSESGAAAPHSKTQASSYALSVGIGIGIFSTGG